ncbi:melanoma antigen preferentially expressed in tumors-like [Rhynchocyon petersi]
MSRRRPPSLLDLAKKSLLKDKILTIAALESLPRELFPPLFIAALAGRKKHILKEMVPAWPFQHLLLGPLMLKLQHPYQDIIKAVLDGLDILLSQKTRPKRWKLQVLDLRRNVQTDFWEVWAGTKTFNSFWSLEDPWFAHFRIKKQKLDYSRTREKQPLASVEVISDLCLKEGSSDEFFRYVINRAKQKKCLPYLCCRTLDIVELSYEIIEEILKMVQLDYIQEIEVDCSWELSTLARFAVYLGQMVNLNRVHLSHIQITPCISPEAENVLVTTVISQFVGLNQLQELYLDSIFFLEGYLDQLLGTSDTLKLLDLSKCELTDTQVTAILPALSHCSELRIFCFCGNLLSMTVLENLLRHTVPLSNFVWASVVTASE